jgi:hypothetical protein
MQIPRLYNYLTRKTTDGQSDMQQGHSRQTRTVQENQLRLSGSFEDVLAHLESIGSYKNVLTHLKMWWTIGDILAHLEMRWFI